MKLRLLTLTLIAFSFIGLGQEKSFFRENFISEEDGAVDLSKYLNTKVGIIPIPILVTEPAVGYGGGVALVYFHRRKTDENGEIQKGFPPSISMLAGAYTENQSYLVAVAHQGSYLDDFLRYTGALGTPNINLKFYGDDDLGGRLGLDFNLKGFFVFQEFLTRINRKLPLFVGFNYVFFANDATFKSGVEEIDEIAKNLGTGTNTGGINVVAAYDTRDNIFTPNNGGFAALDLGFHDQALGGDTNYNNLAFRGYYYLDFVKKMIFGLRYNFHYKWGDVPFFELPFVRLRGIPALRYQNNMVNTAELEVRYNIYKRWSIIGFSGVGSATENFGQIAIDNLKHSLGTGFRYELAREYGLHVGTDFAWGPEQFAWYITFGSAWFR